MAKNNIQLFSEIVDQLNRDEINLAIDLIVERRDLLTREHVNQFKLNDYVSFDFNGETVYGSITKVNKKTLNIESKAGKQYRVSPNYLTKETEVLDDQDIEIMKEELSKNDPFGFSKAINFEVFKDPEKMAKLEKVFDKYE